MAVISQLSVSLNANTKGLERGFKRAQRKVKDFTGNILNIKTAIAGALGIGGLGAMVGDLVSVNSEMQRLKAGLKTVTGSADNAAAAFDQIKQFSVTTPFELNEVTQAFVKLKAYGLDPSERALTAYGNTASAMGKSLDQMIEAVADASTGEFERLKEFGIRASKQGDEVAFTFKGVTETVKLESAAIQNYLTTLAETNFGNAMSDQMNNLGPAFSNFRTAIQDLKISIGEAGLNQAITTLVNNTTAWINSLDAGKIQAFTQTAMGKIAGLVESMQGIYNFVSNNKILSSVGILGYMLFGKAGGSLLAGGMWAGGKLAEFSEFTRSIDQGGITGFMNNTPMVGPYDRRMQEFYNNYQPGMGVGTRFGYFGNEWRNNVGDNTAEKQRQETNGILGEIATTLREQSRLAVAG